MWYELRCLGPNDPGVDIVSNATNSKWLASRFGQPFD